MERILALQKLAKAEKHDSFEEQPSTWSLFYCSSESNVSGC